MKHIKHEQRKSFQKWAMPDQRRETEQKELINDRRCVAEVECRTGCNNIGKNNGPLKHSTPAVNHSTQFTLQKHSIVNDPAGRDARVIPSHRYADYLRGRHRYADYLLGRF